MRSILPLALALSLPACAAVQEGGDKASGAPASAGYARTGPYAAFGILESFEEFDPPGRASASDSDLGFALRGGMRLNPQVAVEATLEDAAGFRLRAPGADADVDLWSLGVQGKYYLTTDRVQPYLLGGLGGMAVEGDRFVDDEDGGYFRVGVGTDLYVNPDTAFFGEASYNNALGDVRRFDHIDFLVGLMVRF